MLTTSIVSRTFINVCSKYKNVVKSLMLSQQYQDYSLLVYYAMWMGTNVLQNSAASIFSVGNESSR